MSLPDSLAEAVATNDQRVALVALRDLLARELDNPMPQLVPQLAARLADVLERIAALPAPREGTALDELARRRGTGDGVAARTVRAGSR